MELFKPELMTESMKTPIKKTYCPYCKRQTDHEVLSKPDRQGTGGKLVCLQCSSSRLDTIQGFDAALM